MKVKDLLELLNKADPEGIISILDHLGCLFPVKVTVYDAEKTIKCYESVIDEVSNTTRKSDKQVITIETGV